MGWGEIEEGLGYYRDGDVMREEELRQMNR